jgi:IS5 family transposase
VKKHEHRKASVRAKVEHPFRVIKRQFGLVKVRFRGLAKNTAHVITLFALSNLWMARRQLMAMAPQSVRKLHEASTTGPERLETLGIRAAAATRRVERARVLTLFRPSLAGRLHTCAWLGQAASLFSESRLTLTRRKRSAQ